MKRLLAALFLIVLASMLIAVMIPRLPEAQTHTFPALDTNNTFTGTNTFSGNVTATAGTNSIKASLVNGTTFPGPKPWVDVTDPVYGAKGDGVTDDAAAIQAAINTMPAPLGGKIFFPCGSYLVKSTLTIPLNTDADMAGEGQCAKIIKDFDSTPLFRSANSSYGTQTTLTANAALGDERLTVTSSAGFVAGNWIQLDDNTGVTASVNCLSYTAYEPAALSCNLGIYRIRSIPDGTHIDITTSLDEPYTTAGLARVSAITPFTADFHDLYFAHGPDCGVANSCTGRMIDLIFPLEVELRNLTMDVGNTIAVVQFHRGKHIKYHDCIIRNGADSLTKNGLGANTVIFDEATAYWEFGPDNNMYKAGETVAQGQSHHGEFHHNTFNGCADSCINTHGNKDHDISMSYNIMGGGSTSDTQNTVSARCIIISDTDFNINADNNVCRNWSQTGIQVVATTQFSIANVSIRNNQIFTPIASTGVFPPNYFLSTVTNPPIGINVQGVDNPKILGNTISGSFPANSVGIQVASSRRAMLVGNHITQTGTVAGDIGIYHITNAAQPSTQMMLVGNIVTGWNSSNCRFDLGASTFAGLNLIGNDCATGPGGTYVYGAGITAIERIGNVGETSWVPSNLTVNLGTTTQPFLNLCLGTAATNNICTAVAAMAAARTLNVLDPGGTSTLAVDASSTYVPATNVFTGAWVCTNVTPVTVNANVATDQNLMACTIPAGTLNRMGRSLQINIAGVYSTVAASTASLTYKVKLCTVSGCGSGTVITLASIATGTTSALTAASFPFNMTLQSTTQTAGASSAYEAHGRLVIDITSALAADSVFADSNTATIGTIDSTGQLFLQVTAASASASASNSWTQRQLIVQTVN